MHARSVSAALFIFSCYSPPSILPSIAQLVERRTVVGFGMQISLGRWFDSGSKEYFFSFCNLSVETKVSTALLFFFTTIDIVFQTFQSISVCLLRME